MSISREELIQLCDEAVVPHDKWRDRDSASAQRQLGECRALLIAGCDFTAEARAGSWWVDVWYRGFNYFEHPGREQDLDTFYIPTRARIEAAVGKDWY